MTRCCHNGCAHPVVPGTTRCEKHTKHHRADECRKRVARRASGKCGLCDRDAIPGAPWQKPRPEVAAAPVVKFPPRGKVGSFRVRAEKGKLVFSLVAQWLGDKPVEVTVGVEAAREIVRLLPALIVEAVKQRATKGGDR